MCWYCHWGWPQPVADIYDRALALAGHSAMHYGPAHIVWDDENFERDSVEWCLEHFNEYLRDDCTAEEMAAVRRSLEELLALPDAIREPMPRAYEDAENADPADYPPAADLVMVRR